MLFSNTTFLGIDPTAGQKPFTYVALDNDLTLLALGQGSMDDILAFAAGQRQCYTAVCAPRRPNTGVMEQPEVRQQLNPQPRPGRWTNFRLAEYQLRRHNISCPQTYAREEECQGWMRNGFALYTRLERIGYCPYPAENASLKWLEVYPHACFCALLGLTPSPKNTLEGRLQRQLILFDQKIRIPDPMDFFEEISRRRLLQGVLPLNELYQPAELDAMVAAFTAWQAALHPGQVTLLGDPDEGQVVLPVAELKAHY